MSVLDAEYLKRMHQSYRVKQAAVDEIIVAVMLEAYQAITGQKARDRFREKIEEAVAYDQ